MRLYEFQSSSDDQPTTDESVVGIANLLTVLNTLKSRHEDEGAEPSFSTDALINMVQGTGAQFDYESLVNAYDSSTAVQNLIKNYSKDTVELAGVDEEPDLQQSNGEDSQGAIEKIAKRVANRAIK